MENSAHSFTEGSEDHISIEGTHVEGGSGLTTAQIKNVSCIYKSGNLMGCSSNDIYVNRNNFSSKSYSQKINNPEYHTSRDLTEEQQLILKCAMKDFLIAQLEEEIKRLKEENEKLSGIIINNLLNLD